VLGEEALEFIDQLAAGGFSVWQFLPLGPTHGHGSPYESLSSFAGNPVLLDLREFVRCDWLRQASYEAVCSGKISSLQARAEAAEVFFRTLNHNNPPLRAAFKQFQRENQYWLDDYCLFTALRDSVDCLPWWQWPSGLAHRTRSALQEARQLFSQQINRVCFEQFMFSRQWRRLQEHARRNNILLFGDLPIYSAHDSADTWSHPELYTLDQSGQCEFVAGVPPDYFSSTGQRWGNPLYHWDRHLQQEFQWWTARVGIQLQRMQLLRIDHFRGLESYWTIPGEADDGRMGHWQKAPGQALLKRLQQQLGQLPFVAEDLGYITAEVRSLLEQFSLPGMKILQFAFGGDAHNPYLPHNHTRNSVVYTGTHDNDTSTSWYPHAEPALKQHVLEYCGKTDEQMPWPIIRCALASVASLAIIPMQDLLSLGTEARMNTPGTIQNNWKWRMHEHMSAELIAHLHDMNNVYGRVVM